MEVGLCWKWDFGEKLDFKRKWDFKWKQNLMSSGALKRSCGSQSEISYGVQTRHERVVKIWLGACERIERNCLLQGKYTGLTLGFKLNHQSCVVASLKTTRINFSFSLSFEFNLQVSEVFSQQGKLRL